MVDTDRSSASGRGGSEPLVAEGRGRVSDRRDRRDRRDRVSDRRDRVGDQRDRTYDRREEAGDQRDQAAEQRDRAGDERDLAGDRRDQAANARDRTADERDRAAEQFEARVSAGVTTDALTRSALARQEGASDRMRAAQDRLAGAGERTRSELDRSTALVDRGASAKERENSGVDDLTGAYLRCAGFAELEREIARARRSEQPLVLAFVDVDRLKALNDCRGHAAGDRMLLEVADTFRAEFRSHDLIIRYGGDEFVCAISGMTTAAATDRVALVNAALAEAPEHGSVTVGLAELHPHDSPEDLVARADAALYRERQLRPPLPLAAVVPPCAPIRRAPIR